MLEARFHLQQSMRRRGTHGAVGELVFRSLFLPLFLVEAEQHIVCRQVAFHQHIHAALEVLPLILEVLPPNEVFGNDADA